LSRDAHLVVTVSTKFEVDTTICCLVIALLLLIPACDGRTDGQTELP